LRSLRVVQAPPVTPTTSNDAVAAMFHERTELHALAVVDGTQPVALINRQQFMNHYATLYFREVHGRKPCLAFANTAPRVVAVPDDLAAALAASPGGAEAFAALSPSRRAAFVGPIEAAKTAETRSRRIAAVIDALLAR
jgi:uncharacterized protein YdeI (YjbR/CyaY-like superfamily)